MPGLDHLDVVVAKDQGPGDLLQEGHGLVRLGTGEHGVAQEHSRVHAALLLQNRAQRLGISMHITYDQDFHSRPFIVPTRA